MSSIHPCEVQLYWDYLEQHGFPFGPSLVHGYHISLALNMIYGGRNIPAVEPQIIDVADLVLFWTRSGYFVPCWKKKFFLPGLSKYYLGEIFTPRHLAIFDATCWQTTLSYLFKVMCAQSAPGKLFANCWTIMPFLPKIFAINL